MNRNLELMERKLDVLVESKVPVMVHCKVLKY